MRRFLLALLAGAPACSDDGGPPPQPTRTVRAQPTEAAPEAPPTGISVIQRDTEDVARDLEELERREIREPLEVERILKRIDILLKATERAIAADAVESVRKRRGLLLQKQSRIRQEQADVAAEIAEIEGILNDFSKGVRRIPPGFTEAEMRDRLGDEREKLRELGKQNEELRRELKECEELLAKSEVPPSEETLFTRERGTLLALRRRAEALRPE